MAFVNYVTGGVLRASAGTSGTSEQDAAFTLPETVRECWVAVDKTAEVNADNTLTVRLQCQVNSAWVDVSWESKQVPQTLTTAADVATVVDRSLGPNILDAYTTAATHSIMAHYKNLPSNVIRTISISAGTDAAGLRNTFSCSVAYMFNRL